MSQHKDYQKAASKALFLCAFNAVATVTFAALFVAALITGADAVAVFVAVFGCLTAFGVWVNAADFQIYQRRADQTRPRHTDYL